MHEGLEDERLQLASKIVDKCMSSWKSRFSIATGHPCNVIALLKYHKYHHTEEGQGKDSNTHSRQRGVPMKRMQ